MVFFVENCENFEVFDKISFLKELQRMWLPTHKTTIAIFVTK